MLWEALGCFKCMGYPSFDEPGATEHGSSDFKGYQETLKMALRHLYQFLLLLLLFLSPGMIVDIIYLFNIVSIPSAGTMLGGKVKSTTHLI